MAEIPKYHLPYLIFFLKLYKPQTMRFQMAETNQRSNPLHLILLLSIYLLMSWTSFAGAEDDCEIIYPPIPQANLDSLAPHIPESFIDISLKMPDGTFITQPAYFSHKKEEIITRRSAFLNASEVIITDQSGDSLQVISKLAEDALGDMIVLKIDKPDQDVEPLEPRFYFPDNGEIIGIMTGSARADKPLAELRVVKHCEDPVRLPYGGHGG
jgi:hypothetical protein